MTAKKKNAGNKRSRGSSVASKKMGTATQRSASHSSSVSEKDELRIKKDALHKFRDEYNRSLLDRVKKRKVGRPTKYDEEKVIAMIDAYAETIEIRNFFSYCSFEALAEFMGIHKDTLYEWMAKYPKVKESVGRFQQKRDSLFYAFVPILKPGSWIFLAKNWLGMTDRQITEIDAHGSLVQYISHMPAPRTGRRNKKKKDKEPDALKEEYMD